MRYCPDCGQEVEPDDAFCFECGAQLEIEETARVSSLGTVWAAGILAIVGLIESLVVVMAPETLLAEAEDVGLAPDLSPEVLMIMGTIGILVSLAVGALSYYYYQQGHVEKRFFWAIVGAGVFGILFAGGFSFFLLIAVGAYGLLVVMRR